MTPQIALDLSLDGISVLSRAGDGVWWREGVVRLDAPDMAEALGRLRDRCAARVGEGFTSILVIPESQLLFTSLERDDRDPKVTIRALLQGRTPYAVEDLTFDFEEIGDRLQVAVVARETLSEAEDFAAGYGFRPVALMSDPSKENHPGQAHFGQTAIAQDLLGGEKLVLDIENGFVVVPAPAPPQNPASEEEVAGAISEPLVTPNFETEAGSNVLSAHPVETAPAVPKVDGPEQATKDPVAPSKANVAPVASPPMASPEEGPATFEAAMEAASSNDIPDDIAEPDDGAATPAFSSGRSGEPTLSAEAVARSSERITPRLSAAGPPMAGASPPVLSVPSTPGSAPPMSGSSGLAGSRTKTAPQEDDAIALAMPGLARDRATQAKSGGLRLGLYLTIALLVLMGLVALWSVMQDDAPSPDVTSEAPALIPEPERADDTTALLPPQNPAEPVEALPEPPVADETASLLPAPQTSSGLRQSSDLATPPLPLAAQDEEPPTSDPAPIVITRTVPIEPVPAVLTSRPAEEDSSAVEAAGAEPEADSQAITQPPATRNATDATEIVADADTASDAPEIEETGLVAASTDGTLAPGGYSVFSGRPALLPTRRAIDPVADTPAAADDGVANDVTGDEVSADLADDAVLVALRRVRPTERPTDESAGAASSEVPLPQIASGFTREELTRVRPRERPDTLTDAATERAAAETARAAEERSAAVEAAAAAAVASLASQATAGTETASVATGSGSRLALPASERPQTRPRTVEREAARIVTTRRQQASAAPARQAAAASTAETDGEEVAPTAQRSGQTIRSAGGSVARAATQRNAIRLREINVIGIYGKPNARRALVRLSNGRYVKVKVGDQLDRGRVVAIGDAQLVYQRGGRNLALNLPTT